MVDKEELIGQLDRWIRGEGGGKYACGRGYANEHDAQCACCLLIAARDVLKSSAQETSAAPAAFPILRTNVKGACCPDFIRWDALSEEWAQRNHGQTLQRLAERGGLGPCEAVANIERRPWKPMTEAAAIAHLSSYALNR